MLGDHSYVCRYGFDVKKQAVTSGFAEDPRGEDAPAAPDPPQPAPAAPAPAPDQTPDAAAAGTAPPGPQTAQEPEGQPARKAARFDAKREFKALEARVAELEPLVGIVSELQEEIKVLKALVRCENN